jgi:hypothetical protein
MLDPARRDQYRTMVGDMIVSYLTTPSAPAVPLAP